MKNQLSPDKERFLAWLDAHRDELRKRLTELTPPELRRFARKIITDLAFNGTAYKYASSFKGHKRFTKQQQAIANIRALARAWSHIVRAKITNYNQSSSSNYYSREATFKLR